MSKNAVVLTSQQIRETFGIAGSGTLTRWKTLGADTAYLSRNRWDLKEFLNFYLLNIADSSDDPSLEAAKLEYWQARAERERVQVDQLKDKLISWAQVQKSWAARVGLVVSGLQAWSARLPPLLVGKDRSEIKNVIRDEVRELRMAYCSKGKYTPPPKKRK